MINVSATKFRNHLFDYLDKVAEGEIIIIRRNQKEVARLIPSVQSNWRDKMVNKPKILVSANELVKPLDEVWEG